MGFQFNEVGGGTRTRRPIALQMHYNAACDEPACYIMDERFSGGEPVDGGAPFERRATLAEARRFIEEENRRLERDQHRSFEAREIVMRVEYRHCPNLVLVDTPGLAGGGGVFGDDRRGGGAPENQPWDLDDEGFYEDDGVAFRGDAEFRAAARARADAPPPGPGDASMQLTLSQTALDGAVGHADANLYGGAQYRRALREFALAVRHLSLPSVDGDEIANALGVGDAHDGADFVRASCVIAVDKAPGPEPQLQTPRA
ncbi:hypothetical protein JL720_14084 [Aureococcus anophagefferens]|nr:hypothetical protein JL720_14084 [Aureococcus anophagefferens]